MHKYNGVIDDITQRKGNNLTDYTVGVLEDAIQILDVLKGSGGGATLAQLTEETGLVKNKVFRLLFTLEKHQLVERDESGVYHLGIRMLTFAQSVQEQNRLLEVSSPVMDWLMEETGETIFLGVANGYEALCVAARVSTQSIRLYAEVGRRAPLHSGGVPKTLLAHMPRQQREAVLAAFTDDPDIPDVEQLRTELAVVREQGYVVVVDELDQGAHSVAAPIFDHQEQVVAGVSIAGPSHRFPPDAVNRYIELVKEAASQISEGLGYRSLQPVK